MGFNSGFKGLRVHYLPAKAVCNSEIYAKSASHKAGQAVALPVGQTQCRLQVANGAL